MRRRRSPSTSTSCAAGCFVMIGAVVAGTVAAYVFHNRVLDWLDHPLPKGIRPVTLGVAEPFTITITVCVVRGPRARRCRSCSGSYGASSHPAVEAHFERKILVLVGCSVALAAAGVAFGLRDPPATRDPFPHDLRQGALQPSDPGRSSYYNFVVAILVGIVVHVPDTARDPRPRCDRRPQLAHAAEAETPRLLHHRGGRAHASRAGSRDDGPRAAADVGAVRSVHLARLSSSSGGAGSSLQARLPWAPNGAGSGKGEAGATGAGPGGGKAVAEAAQARLRRQPEPGPLLLAPAPQAEVGVPRACDRLRALVRRARRRLGERRRPRADVQRHPRQQRRPDGGTRRARSRRIRRRATRIWPAPT